MKSLSSLLLFCLSFFFITQTGYSQVSVSSSVVTSPPATACTNTFLTVAGTHNYAGYTYTGATVNVAGTTVTVTLNYTFGIGLPVITAFSQSVNIGMIPAGSYTLLTNGNVNGTSYSPFTSSLSVINCCGAVSMFTANQPSYCIGDSIYLTNTSTGSILQQWFLNGAPVSNTVNLATVATSTTMNFTLVVTNGSCFDSLSQLITIYSPPQIASLSVTADTVCTGALIVFSSNSTGAIGPNGKIWLKDGQTAGYGTNHTTFAAGVGPHIYTFIASNGACADTDFISVQYLAPPSIDSFNFVSTSICLGQAVTGSAIATGANSLKWYVNSSFVSSGANYSVTPSNTGTFIYKVVATNGYCSDSVSQNIIVNALPVLNLGPDTNACSGTVVLNAGTGFSYLWNDGSTNQFLNVNSAGTYSVIITNSAGCSASDTVVFSSCLALNKISNSDFQLAPNPFTETTTVYLGETHPSVEVVLVDVNGKTFLNEKTFQTDQLKLDLIDLDSGIYFLQIKTDLGSANLKLIKQ